LPLQEKPCKLNDFVVASEASGFSVDDQYVHVEALRSVDADAFICLNLERNSILERSASAGQSVDADPPVAGESRAPAIVARPVTHSVSPHKTRTPRLSGVRRSARHATVMAVAPETRAERRKKPPCIARLALVRQFPPVSATFPRSSSFGSPAKLMVDVPFDCSRNSGTWRGRRLNRRRARFSPSPLRGAASVFDVSTSAIEVTSMEALMRPNAFSRVSNGLNCEKSQRILSSGSPDRRQSPIRRDACRR
jgi:hypothetical protein